MSSDFPYIERPVAADFLIALDAALKAPNSSPLVFNAWGVGGVGKSTLLRKAETEYQQRGITALVEFDPTVPIDPIKLMQRLHQQLLAKVPKVLPSGKPDPFSERYQQYFDLIHKLETESPDGKGAATPEQTEAVKKGVSWLAKGAGSLFFPELAAETIGQVAGATVEGAKLILSEKDRLLDLVRQHHATKGKRELQELILQPVAKLTEAFVQSLILWAKQRPVLLLLDTYENRPADVDNWLWQWVRQYPELRSVQVRLVIMGRNEILQVEGWRKLQQDRPDIVYDRPLNQFDEPQTQDYLQRIGILDLEQQQQIWRATRGLPYYLNWIREQKQKRRELDFAVGHQEIAKLLLQGLEDARKQVIQLAACCRWFDQALIDFLAQQFNLTADFDWLMQQSFVEPKGYQFKLDDVARDVFRQTFWQHDKAKFERTFVVLMHYFKGLSDREVPSNAAPPDKYENPDWRTLRTEYLYYLLFTRQANLQLVWISHLLEARHFNQDELVQTPLQTVEGEAELEKHPYLSFATRQFLQQIRPAVEQGWAMLEEDPIDYAYNQEKHGLSRQDTQKAIEVCLGRVAELEGLAKFTALFYRSRRCPETERFERLMAAKEQAEQIAASTYPEFSSELFLWRIGAALSDLGRKAEAIAAYDQALHYKPDDYEAWYNRGVALSALGRNENAIASYDQAIYYKPDKHEAWYNRGIALSDLGRNEDAIASYDQALHYKSDIHEAWYNRGIALSDLGRKEDAIASFDYALHHKPDYHEAWYNRGVAFSALGRNEEAIASYDQAIHYKPDIHEVWNNRGIALLALERNEEAITSFDQALHHKPDFHAAWNNRGVVLSALGRKEDAIASYDHALHFKSDLHEAWNNRGVALYDLGRNEEAIASYDHALHFKSDDHETWGNRGNALYDLGRNEEAIASYDRALHYKLDLHEAWNNRGVVLYDLGRNEEAIASYDQAIVIKPDKYNAWDNRGNVLVDLKDYEAAVESYDRAIAINPDYCFPWEGRGFALMQLGQYEAALQSLDRAIQLKPDYASAHYNKACCYALQGDVIEAVASLSQAIELDSECRELAKTDTDFDTIRDDDWFRAVLESVGDNDPNTH